MCNAFRHPPGCPCGWGGEGHLGRRDGSFNSYSNYYPSTPEYLWRGYQRNATYSSYVNPNARCPVCRAAVFFYQSPYGGRVFFDELGPPWPKHPCTDNSGAYKYLKYQTRASEALQVPSRYRWQMTGWYPFACQSIGIDRYGRTEIKGRVLFGGDESPEDGHLIYAYVRPPHAPLRDVPLFIRPLNQGRGQYEIATYNVLPNNIDLEPVYIAVYVPSTYRPIRRRTRRVITTAIVPPANIGTRERSKREKNRLEPTSLVATNEKLKIVQASIKRNQKLKRGKPEKMRTSYEPRTEEKRNKTLKMEKQKI